MSCPISSLTWAPCQPDEGAVRFQVTTAVPLLTVDGPIGAHATVHTRQTGELVTAQSVTSRRAHRVSDDQVIDGGLGESFRQ